MSSSAVPAERTIFALRKVQHMDFLAHLLIYAAPGFLPERTFIYQGLQPVGHGIVFVPWIVRQRIAHGIDHVRKDIEPHHVGGAESRALGTTDQRARSTHPPRRIRGRIHLRDAWWRASKTRLCDWR